MDIILLILRLVLAGVFAAAAFGKLADRLGTRHAMNEFGVPASLAAPAALLLPYSEIAVAAALLFDATAVWGAAGCFVLLTAFVLAIAANLALGRKPDCHCFGQIASKPIGWQTLVRNVLLMGAAGAVAWQGPGEAAASLVSWIRGLSAAEAIALTNGLVALVLGGAVLWLLLGLLGQNARMLARLEVLEGGPAAPPPASMIGLSPGTPAPTFALTDIDGELRSLEEMTKDVPALLAFIDPGCGPCQELQPLLARWQREYRDAFRVVAISRGEVAANREKAGSAGIETVLLQQDREVSEAYRAEVTPSAVLVRADGRIGSWLAQGQAQIQSLVEAARSGTVWSPRHSNGTETGEGLSVGSSVPVLALPDLDGNQVNLEKMIGSRTLTLFWNPECGFCQQILSDMKKWENNRRSGAPNMLIISTGTAEANRALDFRSPILLDPDFRAGSAFGVQGTPAAVLVDEAGNIASPVAIGADAILRLL